MNYIAHRIEESGQEQMLFEHLRNTAELTSKFAKEFRAEDWGYICGLLHDIGKYSNAFQRRIRNLGPKVDHSTAGAKEAKKLGLDPISFCIAGHHSGLPDLGNVVDGEDASSLCGRLKKSVSDYSSFLEEIKLTRIPKELKLSRNSNNNDFTLSVFTRMLYSCLVDADYLDTENFMQQGLVRRGMGEPLEILQNRLMNHIQSWLKNEELDTINGHRSHILNNCVKKSSGERCIYKMTMPTGSGKTISSMAFALNHAVKHGMNRIIYVIPYTSIIEQNAKVFKTILGDDNVLEHHSQIEFATTEELKKNQLATENWDAPIVVTTNVQFFESLFSNKSSKCRKLHNIANSVIIFDEVQMLPVEYLNPCIAMIEELVKNYGCTTVLCTATQPPLENLFSKNIKIVELCPDIQKEFDYFKRNTIQSMMDIKEDNLIDNLRKEKSALCIVNTRKRAQAIYDRLKGDGVYHLSTTMYPEHRMQIISMIKERLKDKTKKCVVISTSLVEAGVDLDFQNVYRQMSGMDSILQAAGRCNREGERPKEECKVSVFQFEEKINNDIEQRISATKNALRKYSDWNDHKMVDEYFERLFCQKKYSMDRKNILNQFQNGTFNFKKVAEDFKFIESDTYSIFIPINEEAESILNELRFKGYTKELMRKATRYIVPVYENDFKNYYGAGMLREISDNLEGCYELTNLKQYSEEIGLSLNLGSGEAIMM